MVYRSRLSGSNRLLFAYDRAYGRLRPFLIPRVLRMIMASAVLGAFSVVLRTVGDALGLPFLPLGGLPGALGGFQGVLGGLLGALVALFGATLSSQPDPPTFFGAL